MARGENQVSGELLPTFGRLARWMFSRQALTVMAKVTAVAAAICLLGFVSSMLSVGAARRITASLVEGSYKRAVPDGESLVWLDSTRVRAYPPPVAADSFSRLSLRTRLFAPRTYYAPDPQPPCPDSDSCAWALGVVRISLPYVVRVHYHWFHLAPPVSARSVRGLMELGVVTYVGFFGLAIPIDQLPSPPKGAEN